MKLTFLRPEKVIHKACNKFNIPVVDNETLYRKATAMGLSIKGNDNWHPNDLGYLLIARNIYKTLLELNMVEGNPIKIFSLEIKR
jgi:lysophospholipase L1-like esterase